MEVKSTLCFLLLDMFKELASGSGYFELRLQTFYNTNDDLWDGSNCERPFGGTCDNMFEICVKQFPPLPLSFKSCLYHKNSTNVVERTAVYFQTDNTGIPRNIRINVRKYTGIGFFMRILDRDSESSSDHVDDHAYGEALTPGLNAVTMNLYRRIWGRRPLQKSYLTFSVSVSCDQYYYSNTCERYCRPQNDTRGHYQCSNQGYRVCLNGWFVLPDCLVYCVPHEDGHYDCNKTTGEKICLHGWTGDSCNNNNRSRTIDFSSTTSTKPTKVLPVGTKSVPFSVSRATQIFSVGTRSVQFSLSKATEVFPLVTSSIDFSAFKPTKVLPVVTRKIAVDPIDWLINTNKGKIVISVAGLVLIIIFIAVITRCRKHRSNAVVPFPDTKVDGDGCSKDEVTKEKPTTFGNSKASSFVPLKTLSH